jgi:hypothetical protein
MKSAGQARDFAFNGPVELGLRGLVLLTSCFPAKKSLQQLVIQDYLLVHSDDVKGGPEGLHPKTPHRSGELLVRRKVLQEGLLLYQSRGLVRRDFAPEGVFFTATERSAAFLEALQSRYVQRMRNVADWVCATFDTKDETQLSNFVRDHLGEWGAEFERESLLWSEDDGTNE